MLVIVVDGIIDCRFYAVSISAGLFAPCETRIKSFHGEPFGMSHEDPDAAIDVIYAQTGPCHLSIDSDMLRGQFAHHLRLYAREIGTDNRLCFDAILERIDA